MSKDLKHSFRNNPFRNKWLSYSADYRIQIAIEEADPDLSDASWLQFVSDFARVSISEVTDYLSKLEKK